MNGIAENGRYTIRVNGEQVQRYESAVLTAEWCELAIRLGTTRNVRIRRIANGHKWEWGVSDFLAAYTTFRKAAEVEANRARIDAGQIPIGATHVSIALPVRE